MKRCLKCKGKKALEEFSKDTKSKDGYVPNCKQCVSKYYKANKERILAIKRKWRKRSKDKIKEYNFNYRIENKDSNSAFRLKWSRNNPDKIKKYAMIATKKGGRKAANEVQKAIRKGVLLDLRKVNIQCVDCDKKATVYDHRDYSKPLEVEPVCQRCNILRGKAIYVNS